MLMITFRDYDKDARIDRVWYNSSNILFSECEDKENDYKTLRVVFKNGAQYVYKNVDVKDYILFVHGGTDGSNGKALNSMIKPKYEYEKLENRDLVELENLRLSLVEKKKQLLAEQQAKETEA
jgi:hypothetical protein